MKTFDVLFNYSVKDILDGEKTSLLNREVSEIVYGKHITYVYSTYPFYMDGGFPYMEYDGGVCNAMTWGQLVSPMCKELETIDNSGQFDHSNHSLDEVMIEEITIDTDGDDVIVSMELGS